MPNPRIPILNPEDVSGEVRAVFDDYKRVRGNIPNMFSTLAHRPEIMATANAHLKAILTTGTVGITLKELCIVRVSANNKCAY